LLNLPEEVKDYLINGQISAGHARALINDERAVEKAKDIIENKLNVRSVEKQTKKRLNQDVNLNTDDVKRIENSLNAALKAHATVSVMKDKIRVIIDFSSAWHLEDFMNQLN
jgi:ParB family chromosome partitioning protein